MWVSTGGKVRLCPPAVVSLYSDARGEDEQVNVTENAAINQLLQTVLMYIIVTVLYIMLN